MRDRKVMLVVLLVLMSLACNLAVRAPTPIPTDEMSTISTESPTNTPQPVTAWTTTPETENTPFPAQPTPPSEIRLVTGVSAYYLEKPPTVDGLLNEWQTIEHARIASPVYGIENWTGLDDCSGEAMFGWDEDYLYVAVHVKDNVYVQNATGLHIYKGDSIEILFDVDLAGDFYLNSLNEDDFQLGFSPGNPPGTNTEVYRWLPAYLEGSITEISQAVHTTDVGYDLEIVIPWSVMGVVPEPWQHYGMAISISDNDKEDTTIQQSMVSNDPDRRLTKPMTWGDFVLVK